MNFYFGSGRLEEMDKFSYSKKITLIVDHNISYKIYLAKILIWFFSCQSTTTGLKIIKKMRWIFMFKKS